MTIAITLGKHETLVLSPSSRLSLLVRIGPKMEPIPNTDNLIGSFAIEGTRAKERA